MAQMTALVIRFSFLESSIGSSISGSIYTNTFKRELGKELGTGASQTLINEIYNSIAGVLPGCGTTDRVALGYAVSFPCLPFLLDEMLTLGQYSNVMRYMAYTVLGTAITSFPLV